MNPPILAPLLDLLQKEPLPVDQWLRDREGKCYLPLYTSVDIRNAGFKCTPVDTNLFPAGFNNLCPASLEVASSLFKAAILERVPHCRSILVLAEEHTRNKWYLENARVLEGMIRNAGFSVKVATFLEGQRKCDVNYQDFETATGKTIRMYCLHNILSNVPSQGLQFDFILLNNDLTAGIPDILRDSNIPIYPSLHAGWHSRLKSHHFRLYNALCSEFGREFGIDPWLISCFFETCDDVDIHLENDRKQMADRTSDLFGKIRQKYGEMGIQDTPFIFLKSDTGTYGMGVLPIQDPSELLTLNRKERTKLSKGKGAKINDRFILQEGVPSIERVNHTVAETCLYQIANQFVGSFLRLNTQKNDRENLNSTGMFFKKICSASPAHPECLGSAEPAIDLENCGVFPNVQIFPLYKVLARLSGIAAQREVQILQPQGNGGCQ